MSSVGRFVRLMLVLAAVGCWAQSKSVQQPPEASSQPKDQARHAQASRPNHHKHTLHSGVARPPAALVEDPKPAPPPPPPTPAQQPPNLPQVSYKNGLLTVNANNSSMSDILDMVRKKTGADIDFPPTISQERVAAVVGPAPAPQILATLLNGTRYDYILLGVNGRPDLLQRAIITPREASGAVASAAGPAQPPPRAAAPPQPEEEEPMPEETVEQPEEPQPQPAQVQPGQPQPGANPQFPQQPYGNPQSPQAGQQPGQQQPKTPEQLLQELQRMQQQQQQQQQPQ